MSTLTDLYHSLDFKSRRKARYQAGRKVGRLSKKAIREANRALERRSPRR